MAMTFKTVAWKENIPSLLRGMLIQSSANDAKHFYVTLSLFNRQLTNINLYTDLSFFLIFVCKGNGTVSSHKLSF